MSRWWILSAVILALAGPVRADTAKEAVSALEAEWSKGNGSFTKEYWKYCGDLAAKHGVALIPPILEKAKGWKGEEGLVYVPAVVQIPATEAKPVLERYQKSGSQVEKIWASEFLTEIESYQAAIRDRREYQ